MTRGIACLFLAQRILFAQAQPAPVTFDVASVRTSQLMRAGGEGSRRQRVESSPGSLIMANVTLTTAMKWAYRVQDYQISGPGWIGEDRYDISAKAGSAAPEDQVRLMLQALLADRFKLAFHRQQKEMSAYVVLIGKNGHKMKESENEGAFSAKPNGKMGVSVLHGDLDELAGMMSQPLQAPVINMTGLKGHYDFTVDMAPYLTQEVISKPSGLSDIIPIAITALQEQLGLKLESRKVPVEMLVVDHAEKTPTEN
jgi:uncharacterized protein (TIGR03435 family)